MLKLKLMLIFSEDGRVWQDARPIYQSTEVGQDGLVGTSGVYVR